MFAEKPWADGAMLAWVVEGNLAGGVLPLLHLQQAPVPVVSAARPTTIDSTQDLTLSWNYTTPPVGNRGAQVGLFLIATGTPPGSPPGPPISDNIVACAIPVQRRSVTVPAAALSKLPKGGGFLVLQSQNIEREVGPEKQNYTFQHFGASTSDVVTLQ
jgi:hypothetical protein